MYVQEWVRPLDSPLDQPWIHPECTQRATSGSTARGKPQDPLDLSMDLPLIHQ